jgi:hypothetical protein
VWDVERQKLDVHRNVVPDQSVSSLAYADGLIVGGTSIAGGLGIKPKEKEAKLFVWDPKTNEKVFEAVPSPGAGLISGLIVGPVKNVGGVADGEVFVFVGKGRKVVASRRLTAKSAGPRVGWRDAYMAVHPRDGHVYATVGGRLARIDPKTMNVTVLRKTDAGVLALDPQGRVYFRDRTNLWRYTP